MKLHSRCDLACDHCYVYTMADQRWRNRPRTMSAAMLARTGERIGEHARRHQLDRVSVVLHGGEPLLAGVSDLGRAVELLRRGAAPVPVRMTVQTNGVRLDDSFLRLFDRLDVRVSVSLDGDRTAHDRHRRGPDGRGSHHRVEAALHRLTGSYRRLFNGLLCTVDLRNDPITTYRGLLAHRPPVVDFLLPHGTWSAPPAGRTSDPRQAPYADWLGAVFDEWYSGGGQPTRVRLFDEIIQLLLGGSSRLAGVGVSPVAVAVVETDGAIEMDDTLGTAHAAPGAPACTSTGTTSTPPSTSPASGPSRPGRPGSARSAVPATCTRSAAAASTRTGGAPAAASTTRRCTAPTCTGSSVTSAARCSGT
ncbi:radical SAM protein [Micromonospora parastrephiae]|uniref:radical SAM protein n=1 Tax=Micromonospora parastrephiae TaxID=2806101 RepID=UPI0028161FF3|nr:radical SAM protein [Micromonospora parastrephiae]